MKNLSLAILVPVFVHSEELAFDLAKPGLLRPGNVYAFSIQPTPKSKPFTIRLHAEKETFAKDQSGEPYAGIAKVTATSCGYLAMLNVAVLVIEYRSHLSFASGLLACARTLS